MHCSGSDVLKEWRTRSKQDRISIAILRTTHQTIEGNQGACAQLPRKLICYVDYFRCHADAVEFQAARGQEPARLYYEVQSCKGHIGVSCWRTHPISKNSRGHADIWRNSANGRWSVQQGGVWSVCGVPLPWQRRPNQVGIDLDRTEHAEVFG